jgi:two-component system OmpR family response regulator
MHVHRLRQKVDQGFAYPLIYTVLGAGYMIRAPSETTAPTAPRQL